MARQKIQISQQELSYLVFSSGGSYRGPCPSCGLKTFVARDIGSRIQYRCWRNSCKLSGGFPTSRSIQSITQWVKHSSDCKPEVFVLPQHFVPATSHKKALDYLKSVNALRAYEAGLCDVRYDARLDRVVFIVYYNGLMVNAAGRSLANAIPKWYNYAPNTYPYACGSDRTCAVIVEDVASAAAVSTVTTGIALLGTHLSESHVHILRNYDRLIVALDKDATVKGMHYRQVLGFYRPTSLVWLKQDLKYSNALEIHNILGI